MMMTSYRSRLCLNRILSQSLIVGTLAASGLFCGLVPELSKDSHTLVFTTSAYAQAVNNDELTRYVRASMRIEALRQVVYDEIKRINGGTVPDIPSCSLQGLPGNIAPIWKRFCAQSQELTEREGFSNSRYNAITRMRQEDPNFEQRVKDEAARQRGS